MFGILHPDLPFKADRHRILEALFPTESGYVLRSRLDDDTYKLTMGDYMLRFYPDVNVEYGFKNRTKSVRLAEELSIEDIDAELKNAMRLRFSKDEVRWMKNQRNDGAPLISNEFFDRIQTSRLPSYKLWEAGDGQIGFTVGGNWFDTRSWEIYSLTVVSALLTEARMKRLTEQERRKVVEYTAERLEHKIETLRKHPNVRFSDFGTRRAASPLLQRYICECMLEHLPRGQFVGTSNLKIAMDLQTMPTGTNAHELPMVVAALAKTDEELRDAPFKVAREWWQLFEHNLSILLPDTFGSDFIFKHAPKEIAEKWKGMRQDSMDPFKFGQKLIEFYVRHHQDPRGKLLIPSDGLNLDLMIRLSDHFNGRIRVSHGWGTNLTNDTSLGNASMVVKVIMANGRWTVKLGDDEGKGMGPDDEQDHYRQVFEYGKVQHGKNPLDY